MLNIIYKKGIIMFYGKSLFGKTPDYIYLEIENKEAFLPLVEALFPIKNLVGPEKVLIYM
jgi:hypothetical protein